MQKLLTLLAVLLLIISSNAISKQQNSGPPVDSLVGEHHLYGIDFLFFSNLAEGTLRFESTDEPDLFRAVLVGRTLGVASWLSGDRVQTYETIMRMMPDGSFSSVKHETRVKKKKWGKTRHYQKTCRFDYSAGIITEEKVKKGATSVKEVDIPEDQIPVDMLTAFYNLRLGVYGELARGKIISIPTYSGKGFTDIEVRILTEKQQKKWKHFPAEGVLIKAIIDPEIFETDSGHLYVWFNNEGAPAKGIIEDVIGLGDIRGYRLESGS